MAKQDYEKGLDAARETAKRLQRRAESLAAGMSKETMGHFMNAGGDMVQAANAAMKSMQVPEETKMKIRMAEKEVLLAMKSAIDVVLSELDKDMPKERHELKKIPIRKKTGK